MRGTWAFLALVPPFLWQLGCRGSQTQPRPLPEDTCKTWDWLVPVMVQEGSPTGEFRLGLTQGTHWCCTNDNCSETKDNKTCPEIRVPLENTCNGECYSLNDHYFVTPCENSTVCAEGFNMCNGTHQCQDKGDLTWCKQPERQQEECRSDVYEGDYHKLDLGQPVELKMRCKGGMSGQCIEKRKMRDGKLYHCFDRSDEPLLKKSRDSIAKPLDLMQLQNCSYHYHYDNVQRKLPGLKCGNKCIPMKDWCKQSAAEQCSNIDNRTTTDPELCSNFTFWAGKDCGLPNFYRCTGSWSGQCGDHGKKAIYNSFNPNHIKREGEKCIDKSDHFWLLKDDVKNGEAWHPKECTTSLGKPGLNCFSAPDQRCLELEMWCNRFNPELKEEPRSYHYSVIFFPRRANPTIYKCGPGENDTSLSISVCSNSTLMTNAPCPNGGKRCTGGYKECLPPPEWASNALPQTCFDGSNRNVNESDTKFDLTTDPEASENEEYQIQDWRKPSYTLNGFLTIGNKITSLTKEECASRQGYQCEKSNTKVCLHADLRCNQHPDCDDASDEEGCEEKNPLGGFRCASPHHNEENKATFTPWIEIFATRCDLNPECWEGRDEKGCNNDWAVYSVIGETLWQFDICNT